MALGRHRLEVAPRRDEVVEHWCPEPECQSDPDTATNSQSVAPGSPGSTQSRLFLPPMSSVVRALPLGGS